MNMNENTALSAGKQETDVPTRSDTVLRGPSTTQRAIAISRPTGYKHVMSFKGCGYALPLCISVLVKTKRGQTRLGNVGADRVAPYYHTRCRDSEVCPSLTGLAPVRVSARVNVYPESDCSKAPRVATPVLCVFSTRQNLQFEFERALRSRCLTSLSPSDSFVPASQGLQPLGGSIKAVVANDRVRDEQAKDPGALEART